jgi:pimeloyl-ACP methyl ester carboxylesterase
MRFASLLMLVLSMFVLTASAADALIKVDARPGATVPVYYMKRSGAIATIVLLPGGGGGIGKLADGKPSGQNFLVRSRDYFAEAGFNVAVVSRVSDKNDLEYDYRITPEHVGDLRAVVAFLKKDADLPVWIVGTSRGSVSATATAIVLGKENLAGMVLTSSVVSYNKAGAIPTQNLAKIDIPVLVVHHEKDACKVCAPHEVTAILKGLTSAPTKKLVMVSAGENPAGDPCEALHYHGFIGAEKSTVALIAEWIKKPAP